MVLSRLRHKPARALFLLVLAIPIAGWAQSPGTADKAQAAAGSEQSDPVVERMQQQIVDLQLQLGELQKQLEELRASRRGDSTEQPTLASLEPAALAAAALASSPPAPDRHALTLADARPPQASVAPPFPPQTETLPGRGASDKGLYQGLAAGAPDQRYGRGLFGDVVKIGGYGSFRFEANNIDPGPQIADLPPLKRGFDSFDFRRFVLTLDAAPSKRLRFYTEIEFERLSEIEVERNAIPENRGTRNRAGTRFIQEVEGQSGGEIAIEQAWAQFNFNEKFGTRMGVILPPVGRFNILHDDDYWDLPRRPLVDRGGPVLPVKSAWREAGAGFVGNIPTRKGYVDYQFYVVNGSQLDFALEEVVSLREGRNLLELEPEISFASGPFNGSKTAGGLTWRVAISPSIGQEFAFSGYHGDYTPDYLKQDAWVNALGFDGKLTLGRFEIEGEYVFTNFGRMDAVLTDIGRQFVDAAAQTFSSETSILEAEVETEFAGPLTKRRRGFWVDFKYRYWPLWLDKTFLGRDLENPQLIPIVRFERIWFDDFVTGLDFAGGAITSLEREDLLQQRTTVGLAYRPIASVVFSTAWEHNRRLAGSRMIFPRMVGIGMLPDKSYDAWIFGTAFGF